MAANGGIGDHSGDTNLAVWAMMIGSGLFLIARLWLRYRSLKLWWDDLMLTISWFILLIAAAMVSRMISVGSRTSNDKRSFFLLQNTSVTLTTIATSSTKIAFALTLTRIARHRLQLCFLWFIIATATLILIPGIISTWIPACTDPRAKFRPVNYKCYDLAILQTLGAATMTYGGVVDVLLALFPWIVVRKLQLETREKVGLSVAMSLGAITGVVVVLRQFFQFVQGDFNFDFMVFMSIFAFLEPCVTIVLQVIPIFRVLIVRVKRNVTQNSKSASKTHTSPPVSPMASRDAYVNSKPRTRLESQIWDGGLYPHAPLQSHPGPRYPRGVEHGRTPSQARGFEHKFGGDRQFYDLSGQRPGSRD